MVSLNGNHERLQSESNGASDRKDRVTRVLLVDDHPIVRQGLWQLIDAQPDLTVCGEAVDAVDALRVIPEFNPDVVIVDITLPGMSGIELVKAIGVQHEGVVVLVLSMHDESIYAERVLRAGARGYIMKQEATDKLLDAVRKVRGNEIWVSEAIATQILNRIVDGTSGSDSPVALLTDRELEVFQLIGSGKGTRQIAESLKLSMKTVESHRAHIKEKLRLKNAYELMQHAIQWVQREEG